MMVVWAPLGWWLGRDELPRWGMTEWVFVAISGVLHVVYYVTLLRGYRRADLTVVYPVARGSGPLLSSLLAIALLGERISALGALGIAGVVGGVFLIAGGPGLVRAAHDPASRARIHKGLYYGALTGVFIAAYTLVDGQGARLSGNPVGYVLVLALLEPWGVIAYQWLRRPDALAGYVRRHWATGFLGAGVATSAYAIVLWAMTQAPIAVVAALRESSVIFAVLIGYLWFREGRLRPGLLAAGLVAIGVVLIKH